MAAGAKEDKLVQDEPLEREEEAQFEAEQQGEKAPFQYAEEVEAQDEDSESTATEPENDGAVEEIAREWGWRPEGELSASEYVRRQRSFYEKERKQRQAEQRRSRELEEKLNKVVQYVENQQENEAESREQELRRKIREAYEEGEEEEADKLLEELKSLGNSNGDAKKKSQPAQPPESDYDPDLEKEWLGRNTWFGKDQELTEWAKRRDAELNAQGVSFEKTLQIIEQEAQDRQQPSNEYLDDDEDDMETPTEQRQQRRKSPVQSQKARTPQRRSAQRASVADLSPEEKEIGKTFIAKGVYKNLQEYANDLVKANKSSIIIGEDDWEYGR